MAQYRLPHRIPHRHYHFQTVLCEYQGQHPNEDCNVGVQFTDILVAPAGCVPYDNVQLVAGQLTVNEQVSF